jgi:hypothetical protein
MYTKYIDIIVYLNFRTFKIMSGSKLTLNTPLFLYYKDIKMVMCCCC